jgi:hypothetical protein
MIYSAEKRAFRTNAGTNVSPQHQTPARLTQIIAAVSQTGVGGRCQLFSDDVRCCHVLLGHLICSGLLNPCPCSSLFTCFVRVTSSQLQWNGPHLRPFGWPVFGQRQITDLTCPDTPPVGIPLRKYDEKTTMAEALHSVAASAFLGTHPADSS